MGNDWQRVLTCIDFHDRPVSGIAEVDGLPHRYERRFDLVKDEYGDLFTLTPVEPDLLRLMLEDWQIWLRWEAAFQQGTADLRSHPALPSDRARHDEIQRVIGERLRGKSDDPVVKHGTFRLEHGEWQVIWRGRV